MMVLFKSFAANDDDDDGPVGIAAVTAISESSLCKWVHCWHILVDFLLAGVLVLKSVISPPI